MIEVIYKEEKQEAKGNEGMFSIPRNIRQIGLPNEDYRIYVEDYVYTFLVRLAGTDANGEKEKGHLAVLTGESKWQSGVTYVFVRGALTVDKTEAASDHIDFTEKVWSKIHDEQELYFPGQEIVGWFFAQQELQLEITEVFKRVHLKHFGGGEKVLMLMDPAEREDAFFRYENSFLVRQPGYYLFYEKNPLMQNYMLDKNQEIPSEKMEEVPDEAVVAFRKIIRSKKRTKKEENTENPDPAQVQEPEERTSVFSYAATACLAIAILAVGVNFYRNYQNGYSLEQQIKTASATITKKTPTETAGSPTPAAGVNDRSLSAAASDIDTDARKLAAAKKTETIKENNDDSEKGENGQTGILTVTPPAQDQESGAEQQTSAVNQAQEDVSLPQEESDLRKVKRKQESEEKATGEQSQPEQNDGQQKSAETEQNVSSGSVHASYVIRPGDTLYQISIEKYGSMDAISEICRLNGLTEEQIIYPGQIIVLP